jgi:hypothetical protein
MQTPSPHAPGLLCGIGCAAFGLWLIRGASGSATAASIRSGCLKDVARSGRLAAEEALWKVVFAI